MTRNSVLARAARRRKRQTAALVAALLGIVSFAACAQAPIWTDTWRIPAPTPFSTGTQPDFAFSSDGELTFAQISGSRLDYQYTRINADGSARWSANLGVQFYTEAGNPKPLLPYADGSAIVGLDLGFREFSRVAKIGADGSVAWMRAFEANSFVALPNQRVLAVGCASLVVLDATNGNLVWQYGRPDAAYGFCGAHRAAGDANGNVYAVSSGPSPGDDVVAIRLDPAGQVVWQRNSGTASSSADLTLLGVSEGLLFQRTTGELRVLHAEDGSPAWSKPFVDASNNAAVLAGSPAEAVVIDGTTASRLANTDGSARWASSLSAASGFATATGDAIVALESGGVVAKIDPESGAVAWETPLPTEDADGNALNFVGAGVMGSGTLVAVASRVSPFAAPPFMQKIDFATGEIAATVAAAPVPQGVAANSIAEDASHIVGATLAVDDTAWSLHVRRIDAATGSVAWESVVPLDYPVLPWTYSLYAFALNASPEIAVSGTTVAVGVSVGGAFDVATFDRGTGAVRWNQWFGEPYASQAYFTAPAIDAEGNVYIEDDVTYTCNPQYVSCCPQMAATCYALRLYKLAAVDGATVWRRDGPAVNPGFLSFVLAGSDAVLAGPFTGDLASSTVARLAGSDGSTVVWSSAVLPDYGISNIVPLPDDSLEVFGNGWAKIDSVTGDTVWSFPVPQDPICTQDNFCHVYDGSAMANGDYYSVGESQRTLRVQRLHGDGSGQADVWYPVPAVPGTRLAGTRIARDADDKLWLRLVRSVTSGPATLVALTSFDPAGGTIASQQVIGAYENTDSLAPTAGADLLSAPASGLLPVRTLVSEPPQPASYGDALLNVAVSAHGDLSVSASLDPPHVAPGQLATFHLVISYSGDAPIAGVQALAAIPWPSGVTSLSCIPTGASNCSLDTRADALRASFDIEPGGSIEITGSVNVIDLDARSDPPVLSAVAYGGPGLAEPDTLNNFGSATVTQSLFFDGFE